MLQATLKASVGNQQVSTVVSTSELSITTGQVSQCSIHFFSLCHKKSIYHISSTESNQFINLVKFP